MYKNVFISILLPLFNLLEPNSKSMSKTVDNFDSESTIESMESLHDSPSIVLDVISQSPSVAKRIHQPFRVKFLLTFGDPHIFFF